MAYNYCKEIHLLPHTPSKVTLILTPYWQNHRQVSVRIFQAFRGMLSKILVGIYNIQHTYGSLTGVSGRVAIVNQVFREAVVQQRYDEDIDNDRFKNLGQDLPLQVRFENRSFFMRSQPNLTKRGVECNIIYNYPLKGRSCLGIYLAL